MAIDSISLCQVEVLPLLKVGILHLQQRQQAPHSSSSPFIEMSEDYLVC